MTTDRAITNASSVARSTQNNHDCSHHQQGASSVVYSRYDQAGLNSAVWLKQTEKGSYTTIQKIYVEHNCHRGTLYCIISIMHYTQLLSLQPTLEIVCISLEVLKEEVRNEKFVGLIAPEILKAGLNIACLLTHYYYLLPTLATLAHFSHFSHFSTPIVTCTVNTSVCYINSYVQYLTLQYHSFVHS